MMRSMLALTLTAAAAASAGAADTQTDGSPLVLRPALYVVGAIDETHGISSALDQELLEPPRSFSLGAALDTLWEGRATRLQGSLFGMLHSPFSGTERGVLLAGRVHAVRGIGAATRLTLDDSARLQRRSDLGLTDYARNEVVVGLEWQSRRGPSWTLRASDRRRSVTELSRLGFDRQALTLGSAFALGPRLRLAVDLGANHFASETTHGEGGIVTFEMAHLSRHRTLALRAAWFVPISDRAVNAPAGAAEVLNYVVGPAGDATLVRGTLAPGASPLPIAEAEPVQTDTLLLADGPVGRSMAGDSGMEDFADPFLFDPLESDSDEWSFGRHKQVVAVLLSQPIATRTRLTLLGRYQHSSGRNLLESPTLGIDTFENRLWLRLTLRQKTWGRTSVFVHGGYLVNRSTDDTRDFSRSLLVGGIEIPF